MANKVDAKDEILSEQERFNTLEAEVEHMKEQKYVFDCEVDLNVIAAKCENATRKQLKLLLSIACGFVTMAEENKMDNDVPITMADLDSAWKMVEHIDPAHLETKGPFKQPTRRGRKINEGMQEDILILRKHIWV